MTDFTAARANLLATVKAVRDALVSAGVVDIGAVKFSPGQDLGAIESEYNTRLYGAMDDYLNTGRPITSFRNEYRRVVNDGFNMTAVAGWIDGGANGPISADLQDWINGQIEREMDYVDELFQALKELRARTGEMTATDMDERANFIQARADGYTNTLGRIYDYSMTTAKMQGGGRFVWRRGPTEQGCQTCTTLDGVVATADEWEELRKRGIYPQSPELSCHGDHCLCTLEPTDKPVTEGGIPNV